jgi:hypothetical protein
MKSFFLLGTKMDAEDASSQDQLAAAYDKKERPLCLCMPDGIPMYISRFQGRFLLKRMPGSGTKHHVLCDSFEPPPELSGLGDVQGQAIKEDTEEGITTLRLDFSLTKGAKKAPPTPGEEPPDTVRTDGAKLTLRSLLHYLWDQAGFNRWSPNMQGKRSWPVIHKYLLQAAQSKSAKRHDLSELLFVPEPFVLDRKDEIAHRRHAQFARVMNSKGNSRQLMVCIGEVKEKMSPSRYGYRAVLKHLPDCHFMLDEQLHRRLIKRFNTELALWDAVEDSHLIMISTFSVSAAGVVSVEEAALMCTDHRWLPFENQYERDLIDKAASVGHRFVKGMRYNLPSSTPLASLVTLDTDSPVACYLVPPEASAEYEERLDELIGASTFNSWTWRCEDEPMPVLPSRVEHV